MRTRCARRAHVCVGSCPCSRACQLPPHCPWVPSCCWGSHRFGRHLCAEGIQLSEPQQRQGRALLLGHLHPIKLFQHCRAGRRQWRRRRRAQPVRRHAGGTLERHGAGRSGEALAAAGRGEAAWRHTHSAHAPPPSLRHAPAALASMPPAVQRVLTGSWQQARELVAGQLHRCIQCLAAAIQRGKRRRQHGGARGVGQAAILLCICSGGRQRGRVGARSQGAAAQGRARAGRVQAGRRTCGQRAADAQLAAVLHLKLKCHRSPDVLVVHCRLCRQLLLGCRRCRGGCGAGAPAVAAAACRCWRCCSTRVGALLACRPVRQAPAAGAARGLGARFATRVRLCAAGAGQAAQRDSCCNHRHDQVRIGEPLWLGRMPRGRRCAAALVPTAGPAWLCNANPALLPSPRPEASIQAEWSWGEGLDRVAMANAQPRPRKAGTRTAAAPQPCHPNAMQAAPTSAGLWSHAQLCRQDWHVATRQLRLHPHTCRRRQLNCRCSTRRSAAPPQPHTKQTETTQGRKKSKNVATQADAEGSPEPSKPALSTTPANAPGSAARFPA